MENKVSVEIPAADLQAIKDAIAVLNAKLSPVLIALTNEQRRDRAKMGEASKPFVEKVLEYAVSNPQFVPAFAKVPEMQSDWKAYQELNPVFNSLNQICSNLNDTLLELGVDLLKVSNAYYNQVKQGVKMDVPNAKPIEADLRVRYQRKPKKNGESPISA
jgi:hypothetical protein